MFAKKFDEHKKEIIPIAAGAAVGLTTRKHWLKELKGSVKQHDILKKTHGAKAKVPYKKMLAHAGKGAGTLFGSVAAGNLGARYLISKLKKED